MSNLNPPLRGDGHGIYRIHIVGNSGTGKSTLGAYISRKLSVAHIPLDELRWKPGWQQTPNDEFREMIKASMLRESQGWVIDGNARIMGTLIFDSATDIIWLDPPLHCYLPRLVWRTLTRILGATPPCAEGCRETWREIFTRDGVVWYCVTQHAVTRTKYTAFLSEMGVDIGGKMRRLDESRGELAAWKDELDRHVRRI